MVLKNLFCADSHLIAVAAITDSAKNTLGLPQSAHGVRPPPLSLEQISRVQQTLPPRLNGLSRKLRLPALVVQHLFNPSVLRRAASRRPRPWCGQEYRSSPQRQI